MRKLVTKTPSAAVRVGHAEAVPATEVRVEVALVRAVAKVGLTRPIATVGSGPVEFRCSF